MTYSVRTQWARELDFVSVTPEELDNAVTLRKQRAAQAAQRRRSGGRCAVLPFRRRSGGKTLLGTPLY